MSASQFPRISSNKSSKPQLGGGNSNIFRIFIQDPWKIMIQFDLRIFFKWVETTN